MAKTSVKEIKIKIAEYLTSKISLSDLNDWIASIAWDINDSTDSETSRLIYSVELRIAEYENHFIDRKDFIELLEALAEDPNAYSTGTTNKTVVIGEKPNPFGFGFFGNSPLMEFGSSLAAQF